MRGDAALYDVRAALARLGVSYDERDGEAWALCPGHLKRLGREDRSASWSINLASGLHHCFSCGFNGNLLTLITAVTHMTYQQAEAWVVSPEMLAAALEGRHWTSRRTTAADLIRLPECTLPPLAELEARRISIEAAIRYEILWDGKGFILPIRNPRHELIGYQLKRGKYVRNRPRGVAKGECLFGFGAFTGSRAVVLEAPLDVARMWSAGVDGPLGTFGAQVTDAQIDLIVQVADSAVVALDDDNPGEIAADEVETKLAARIWPVRRFRYPEVYQGKDPGDLTDTQALEGVTHARTRLERLAGS